MDIFTYIFTDGILKKWRNDSKEGAFADDPNSGKIRICVAVEKTRSWEMLGIVTVVNLEETANFRYGRKWLFYFSVWSNISFYWDYAAAVFQQPGFPQMKFKSLIFLRDLFVGYYRADDLLA